MEWAPRWLEPKWPTTIHHLGPTLISLRKLMLHFLPQKLQSSGWNTSTWVMFQKLDTSWMFNMVFNMVLPWFWTISTPSCSLCKDLPSAARHWVQAPQLLRKAPSPLQGASTSTFLNGCVSAKKHPIFSFFVWNFGLFKINLSRSLRKSSAISWKGLPRRHILTGCESSSGASAKSFSFTESMETPAVSVRITSVAAKFGPNCSGSITCYGEKEMPRDGPQTRSLIGAGSSSSWFCSVGTGDCFKPRW